MGSANALPATAAFPGLAAHRAATEDVANADAGLAGRVGGADALLAFSAAAIVGTAGLASAFGLADAGADDAAILGIGAAARLANARTAVLGAAGFALTARLTACGRLVGCAIAVIVAAVAGRLVDLVMLALHFGVILVVIDGA